VPATSATARGRCSRESALFFSLVAPDPSCAPQIEGAWASPRPVWPAFFRCYHSAAAAISLDRAPRRVQAGMAAHRAFQSGSLQPSQRRARAQSACRQAFGAPGLRFVFPTVAHLPATWPAEPGGCTFLGLRARCSFFCLHEPGNCCMLSPTRGAGKDLCASCKVTGRT